MLHNIAEPKLTPRSQKAHRGAKKHTAEPNIVPRSHFISTAEPTPQRGEFLYLWASVLEHNMACTSDRNISDIRHIALSKLCCIALCINVYVHKGKWNK